jgi:hypothetical protein
LKSTVICVNPLFITTAIASANVATRYSFAPGIVSDMISASVKSPGFPTRPPVSIFSSRGCNATRWSSLVRDASTSTHSWPAATAAASAGTVFGNGRRPIDRGQSAEPTVPCAQTMGSRRAQNVGDGARTTGDDDDDDATGEGAVRPPETYHARTTTSAYIARCWSVAAEARDDGAEGREDETARRGRGRREGRLMRRDQTAPAAVAVGSGRTAQAHERRGADPIAPVPRALPRALLPLRVRVPRVHRSRARARRGVASEKPMMTGRDRDSATAPPRRILNSTHLCWRHLCGAPTHDAMDTPSSLDISSHPIDSAFDSESCASFEVRTPGSTTPRAGGGLWGNDAKSKWKEDARTPTPVRGYAERIAEEEEEEEDAYDDAASRASSRRSARASWQPGTPDEETRIPASDDDDDDDVRVRVRVADDGEGGFESDAVAPPSPSPSRSSDDDARCVSLRDFHAALGMASAALRAKDKATEAMRKVYREENEILRTELRIARALLDAANKKRSNGDETADEEYDGPEGSETYDVEALRSELEMEREVNRHLERALDMEARAAEEERTRWEAERDELLESVRSILPSFGMDVEGYEARERAKLPVPEFVGS